MSKYGVSTAGFDFTEFNRGRSNTGIKVSFKIYDTVLNLLIYRLTLAYFLLLENVYTQ